MKTATLATAARPAITSTISVLSDRKLLRQTSTLVRHERHLQGAIIDHLAEIEARRLFLHRGCSSLFDYAVRELGYSDADCQQGLEQLRGLLSHVDPRMTIGQLVGRIVREALDRHDPSRSPRRARAGTRAAEGESKPASASKEQAARERDHATAAQDAAIHVHATPTAEGTEGATRQPAPPSLLSPGHDTASAAGTTPTAERAEERTPHPRPASVAPRTRQEATDRPAAARTTPAATTSTPKPRASGRAIPTAVKRQVWQRDGGRCSYLDRQTGRRCNSRHMIEMDHILPYALGGGADPENLRLVCRAHHRHRHAPYG